MSAAQTSNQNDARPPPNSVYVYKLASMIEKSWGNVIDISIHFFYFHKFSFFSVFLNIDKRRFVVFVQFYYCYYSYSFVSFVRVSTNRGDNSISINLFSSFLHHLLIRSI